MNDIITSKYNGEDLYECKSEIFEANTSFTKSITSILQTIEHSIVVYRFPYQSPLKF